MVQAATRAATQAAIQAAIQAGLRAHASRRELAAVAERRSSLRRRADLRTSKAEAISGLRTMFPRFSLLEIRGGIWPICSSIRSSRLNTGTVWHIGGALSWGWWNSV